MTTIKFILNAKRVYQFLGLLICMLLIQVLPSKLLSEDFTTNPILDKITFDISEISADGLIGSVDGLRYLSYEFCIPGNEQAVERIKTIDSTINIYRQSPGRINCQNNQYLCVGETHNKQWKEILLSIAKLDYVERIDQFWGE
ncbi:hypothetical protein cce_3849 [Crocosphaera subtropica ATCC 51142]|uniref:Uncharacterized protein n=1 Tax=Crocosphaera subtropica (strain ATCC 51142 / BH68) TaxID=43989 RepID=B1WP18_CROS5|nr:hypothetical protein [Crocosphaera subtropica]ACB53197.1 hypothetical protein cce_3849 [Crocosphaera subtropica ATCC 51142]